MGRSTPTGDDRGPGCGVRGPLSAHNDAVAGVRRYSRALRPVPGARCRQAGFTLAAMMVIMAIMAIFLTVAVETASFQQKREKEEELIFRGNQVVEAIRLFRARFGRFPIALDELAKANPRVLRKIWNDPMTGRPDWVPVYLGEEGTTLRPLPGGLTPTPQPTPQPTPGPGTPGSQGPRGGPIIGVRSSVCGEAVKIYDGHTRYCEWKFFYDPTKLNPGIRPASAAPPSP